MNATSRGQKQSRVSLPTTKPISQQSAARQSDVRLSDVEAIALFNHRAGAVKPDFRFTDENVSTVAEICTRLDGLPLAIELAAARMKIFSPQALLQELENRLSALQAGPRDLPACQRTLPGVLVLRSLGAAHGQFERRFRPGKSSGHIDVVGPGFRVLDHDDAFGTTPADIHPFRRPGEAY